MDVLGNIYNDWIWNERFWLPENVTWKMLDEVETDENIRIARPRQMLAAFPIAVIFFIARILWERLIALPIGRYLKIKETVISRPVHNEVLEHFYKKSKRVPSYKSLEELSKKTSMTVREIERWWRRRRNHDKPSEIVRWKETSWRFIYYFVIFWYGFFMHLDKSWFWDTKHCWYGYPHQNVSADVYWYFMVQLGFYLSLLCSLFTDVRRKDFVEMNIHHLATIVLLVCSWTCSMVRAGTLILLLHDTVDYWMEGAKLLSYAGFQKLCDICFVTFTILWFITRIVLFPIKLVYTCSVEVHSISGIGLMWRFSFPFLLVLQVLHIFWFYTILKMVYFYVIKGKVEVWTDLFWFYTILKMVYFYVFRGKVEKDDRSASEAECSEDDLPPEGKNDKTPSNNNRSSKDGIFLNGLTNQKPSENHHIQSSTSTDTLKQRHT